MLQSLISVGSATGCSGREEADRSGSAGTVAGGSALGRLGRAVVSLFLPVDQ